MKILWAVALCTMFAISSQEALANAVEVSELVSGKDVLLVLQPGALGSAPLDDPQIMVRRLRRGSTPFHGFTFSFESADGNGDFDFFNANHQALLGLTFTITPGGPPDSLETLFQCGTASEFKLLPFSDCQFLQLGGPSSSTIVRFYGPPGLPPLSHFGVELLGFLPNTTVTAVVNPAAVPEPGMMILFLTGAGTLLVWRRLRSGSL